MLEIFPSLARRPREHGAPGRSVGEGRGSGAYQFNLQPGGSMRNVRQMLLIAFVVTAIITTHSAVSADTVATCKNPSG